LNVAKDPERPRVYYEDYISILTATNE